MRSLLSVKYFLLVIWSFGANVAQNNQTCEISLFYFVKKGILLETSSQMIASSNN